MCVCVFVGVCLRSRVRGSDGDGVYPIIKESVEDQRNSFIVCNRIVWVTGRGTKRVTCYYINLPGVAIFRRSKKKD